MTEKKPLNIEPAPAFHAKQIYFHLGPNRDLSSVARALKNESEQSGDKSKRSLSSFLVSVERWSSKYKWREQAAEFDHGLASAAALSAQKKYIEELEKHKNRYAKLGNDAYLIGKTFLNKMGKRLEAMNESEIDMSRFAVDFGSLMRALALAGDLEAHSLQVEKLSAMFERREKQE